MAGDKLGYALSNVLVATLIAWTGICHKLKKLTVDCIEYQQV